MQCALSRVAVSSSICGVALGRSCTMQMPHRDQAIRRKRALMCSWDQRSAACSAAFQSACRLRCGPSCCCSSSTCSTQGGSCENLSSTVPALRLAESQDIYRKHACTWPRWLWSTCSSGRRQLRLLRCSHMAFFRQPAASLPALPAASAAAAAMAGRVSSSSTMLHIWKSTAALGMSSRRRGPGEAAASAALPAQEIIAPSATFNGGCHVPCTSIC